MKIGVISDTHIPEQTEALPEKVLEALRGSDLILHAGDLTDQEVLETLETIAPVKAVSGNMDSLKVRKLLPAKEVVIVDKFKIGIIHGWGNPKNLLSLVQDNFKDIKLDVIVFGHSHSAFNECVNDILMFNPGSPTDKFFSPYNSIGILEISDRIKGKIIKI